MNPQTARWHFKFRTLINAVCVGAGFVLITLFTVQIEGGILIMLVAGGAGYFLFFHVLPNRVIPMSCPHCFGHIATNTPWVCPSCEKKNQNTDEYPFIHRCEHCKTEPKAYICHHKSCGKPIFFSLDTDERLAAVSYSKPAPPPPSPAAERRAEKEDLLHEIEMAELADRLDSIDRRKKLAKEKTPAEEIEDVRRLQPGI